MSLREEVLSFRCLLCRLALIRSGSSVLKSLDCDLSIEGCGCKEVGIGRMESRLESPVRHHRKFAELFSAVRVPSNRAIVLSTGQ